MFIYEGRHLHGNVYMCINVQILILCQVHITDKNYCFLQIYKSVKSSHTLEVYESAAINRLKMNKKDFNSLSHEDIMNIKIRYVYVFVYVCMYTCIYMNI
jgi:hypothetical protein